MVTIFSFQIIYSLKILSKEIVMNSKVGWGLDKQWSDQIYICFMQTQHMKVIEVSLTIISNFSFYLPYHLERHETTSYDLFHCHISLQNISSQLCDNGWQSKEGLSEPMSKQSYNYFTCLYSSNKKLSY